MEVMQPTIAASLVVVIYVLIEKVIVPLLSKGKNNVSNDRNNRRSNGQHQEYVKTTFEHRLNRIEKQLIEHRDTIGDVGGAVRVIKAIVERIEEKTK